MGAGSFWYVTGEYFTGSASVRVWGTLAVLLASVIAEVRIAVLLSYYGNDLFSALQMAFQGAGAHDAAQRASGVHGFWVAIGIFVILASDPHRQARSRTYLTQRFIIALAGVADPSPHRGLADRPGVLPGPVRAHPSTTQISGSSRTSTS